MIKKAQNGEKKKRQFVSPEWMWNRNWPSNVNIRFKITLQISDSGTDFK